MGEAIAVLSGKGGTGKTSICAGIATALAREGKRVLCIDCDVGLRNLDISLGMSDVPSLSFQDICRGGYCLEQLTCHSKFPTLWFLTAPMNISVEEVDTKAFGSWFTLPGKNMTISFWMPLPGWMPVFVWQPPGRIGYCWSPVPTLPRFGMPDVPVSFWN